MGKLKNVNVNINGFKEAEVITILNNVVLKSTTGASLIRACGMNSLSIRIDQNGMANDASKASKIVLGYGAMKGGVREIAESALFEMQNSVNMPKYDGLKNKWTKDKSISLLKYSVEKCNTETMSSETFIKICKEMKWFQELSGWGKKQCLAEGFAKIKKKSFEQHFGDVPHGGVECTAGPGSIKSRHLYAHDVLMKKLTRYILTDRMQSTTFSRVVRKSGGKVKTEQCQSPAIRDVIIKVQKLIPAYTRGKPVATLICGYIIALCNMNKLSEWEVGFNGPANEWEAIAEDIARGLGVHQDTLVTSKKIVKIFEKHISLTG